MNETCLKEKLQELYKWFQENPKLPQDIEPILLKRFLKCMFGNVEDAKKLIELNYTLRNKNPHMYINRDPQDESTQNIRNATDLLILPKVTPDNYKIMFFRMADYDPSKMNSLDEVKLFYMLTDSLFTIVDAQKSNESKVQSNGIEKNSADTEEESVQVNNEKTIEAETETIQNGLNEDKNLDITNTITTNNIESTKSDAKLKEEDDNKSHKSDSDNSNNDVELRKESAENSNEIIVDEYKFNDDDNDDSDLADGYVQIVDCTGYTMAHMTRISFMVIRTHMKYLQEAYPVRLKAMHCINCPSYIDKMIAFVRPFIREDVFNMMHFHPNGLDTLYEYIPRELLPHEYGGDAGKVADLKAELGDLLLKKRDYLMDSKYWIVEKEAPRKRWTWF